MPRSVGGKRRNFSFVNKLRWMCVARACFIKSRASLHLKPRFPWPYRRHFTISHTTHTHLSRRWERALHLWRCCSDLDSVRNRLVRTFSVLADFVCHRPWSGRETKMHLTLVYCVVGNVVHVFVHINRRENMDGVLLLTMAHWMRLLQLHDWWFQWNCIACTETRWRKVKEI